VNFTIRTTIDPKEVASFIVLSILKQLESGQRVLFLVAGGSSMVVALKVAELLRNYPQQNLIKNLTITLTDERYGPLDHSDSNWYQLLRGGFALSPAKLIPILSGDDFMATTKKFNENLNQEFRLADYKIGLFGIGADGHTAGILPGSEAVKSEDLACGYDTPTFSRVTITPKTIEKLDEAIVWTQGENKWSLLENFGKNIDIIKQPTQVLKRVSILTIFTDYAKR